MITLIGVGHVFAISDQITELIHSKHPAVVCLELDPARFNSLVNRSSSRRGPPQYAILAQIQRRMAAKFGSEVGNEMLAAAHAARDVGAKLALIDLDSTAVFGRLWRTMTLKEKFNLLFSALVGLVASKETVEHEIEKYEGGETEYIESMAKEFPSVKKVLLDERNTHMAGRIASIASEHSDVVAVVGDGHIQGIADALGESQVEVVRLKDIRKMTSSDSDMVSCGEVSFSYWSGGQSP
jgi:pheromone shutdown protein TraB